MNNDKFFEWLSKCPLLFDIKEDDEFNLVINFYKNEEVLK